MPRHGKKFRAALEKVDLEKQYGAEAALTLIKEVAYANFDETVEVHARTGIDPRQAEQAVRTMQQNLGRIPRCGKIVCEGRANRRHSASLSRVLRPTALLATA